jgi:hypothetical protein
MSARPKQETSCPCPACFMCCCAYIPGLDPAEHQALEWQDEGGKELVKPYWRHLREDERCKCPRQS